MKGVLNNKLVKSGVWAIAVVLAVTCVGVVPDAGAHAQARAQDDAHISVADTSKKEVEKFKNKWNKKVNKLDKKIKKAEAKANAAADEKKILLNEKVEDLKDTRDDLKKNIDAAGDQAADTWEDFTQKVSTQYNALSDKISDFFAGRK